MARSSAKAEYRSMASTALEITWLSFLLHDLGIPQPQVSILHCDNLSALYMSVNPILHARTKHIKLDYHYIRECVVLGALLARFVSSSNQLADIFTKPLSKVQCQSLRVKLGLCPCPRPCLRGSDRITPIEYNPSNEQTSKSCTVITAVVKKAPP